MEKNSCNIENNSFLFSNSLIDDLTNELNKYFAYQNIMIIGINNNNYETQLRGLRQFFNFIFCNDINLELLENTRCVVLFDDEINLKNINICLKHNKRFLLVSNNYLLFDYFSYIKQTQKESLLMRIIINNEELQKNKSQIYCNFLMELFCYKFQRLEEELNQLFFGEESSTVVCNNELNISYENFSPSKDLVKLNYLFAENYNFASCLFENIVNIFNEVGYKFLTAQIVLNLYKNFITYISPNLIGKIENFTFNYEKFWFVKQKCENMVLDKIEKLENLCDLIKINMSAVNVDYYFNVSKCYEGVNFVDFIKETAKIYNKRSLIKIIYEMGLMEFEI